MFGCVLQGDKERMLLLLVATGNQTASISGEWEYTELGQQEIRVERVECQIVVIGLLCFGSLRGKAAFCCSTIKIHALSSTGAIVQLPTKEHYHSRHLFQCYCRSRFIITIDAIESRRVDRVRPCLFTQSHQITLIP